ncbi:MAG: hypothetical protein RL511_323 [Bacteroidota bacterium]|jgi:hypothetical protein
MKILLLALFCSIFTCHLSAQKSVNFTFHNGSLKSIPLVIPTVMNPNLSPMSNSGITLDMGQVVYFFSNGNKGKKEVLFVVSDTFKDGDVLEIDQLIAEKKKAQKQ